MAGTSPPACEKLKTFFLSVSMRTHNSAPQKLPAAWEKLSAPGAAPWVQERGAPRCSGPAGASGFPGLSPSISALFSVCW